MEVSVTVSECDGDSVWQWISVITTQCDNDSVWQWPSVTMIQCDSDPMWQRLSVTATQCDSDSVWQWLSVTVTRCDSDSVWQWLNVTAAQCDSDSVWQWLNVTAAQCDSDRMWHLSLSYSIYIPHLNSRRAIYIRPEAQIKFPLWATKVCQHPHCYDFELPERQRMPPNICCGQERQLAEGDTYSEEAESVVCTTAISILCLDIWQYGGALRPVRVSATRLLRRDRLHGLPHLLWRQSAARCRISQSTVRSQREIRLTGQ